MVLQNTGALRVAMVVFHCHQLGSWVQLGGVVQCSSWLCGPSQQYMADVCPPLLPAAAAGQPLANVNHHDHDHDQRTVATVHRQL